MSAIPFIGRLHLVEYLALVASFALLILEVVVRTITLALPGPIIRFCYLTSRRAFNSLSSPRSRRNRSKKKGVSSPIAQAQDFVELCELYGYYAEEHIVQTKDGYLLGLHRLGWKRGEEEATNTGQKPDKKVVYLHHGLMMNSEVWVCLTERERCLPFVLVEQGYDVWLGNNRGNKYSKKSLRHSPTDAAFWDFSMDQFAFHDIPDSIDYILSTTQQPSLSYIGFSQGTAQAFAALSIHPTLNHKVDVFVALAPAMAPPGLASGVVSSFVKSSPEILFLAFGRRAILGSATMWQALLYPGIFIYFIDKSLKFLFNWNTQNITAHQKLAAYPHLYSFSSTKSVVHWFQIIRNGTFQMYDDEVTTPWQFSNGSKYYKVAKFPTRNIKTPIVLVYGGSDSLVDIKLMLKELPRHTVAKGIEKYEHLDLLWASDVDRLVFPHVLEALENYGAPLKTKVAALGWHPSRPGASTSPVGSQPPGYSEDETRLQRSQQGLLDHDGPSYAFSRSLEHRPSTADELEALDESEYDDTDNERHPFITPERLRDHSVFTSSSPSSRFPGGRTLNSPAASRTITTITRAAPTAGRRILSPRLRSQDRIPPASPRRVDTDDATTVTAATVIHDPQGSSTRAPEGWWSSSNASVHEVEGVSSDITTPKQQGIATTTNNIPFSSPLSKSLTNHSSPAKSEKLSVAGSSTTGSHTPSNIPRAGSNVKGVFVPKSSPTTGRVNSEAAGRQVFTSNGSRSGSVGSEGSGSVFGSGGKDGKKRARRK